MKFKKTYSFAFYTALALSSIVLFLSVLLIFGFHQKLSFIFLISFILIFFLISFFWIQYRVEKFIYQRVKKIYNSVRLLDVEDLRKMPITSDMDRLSEEVQKFARKKSSEIENLNKQAVFRREYMGNVAHELKTPLFSIQSYLLTLIESKNIDKKLRKKYLVRAEKNVERLVNIVEDLDLISRMDSNMIKLHIQKFDFVALVKNVFEMLELNASKYQVVLQLLDNYQSIWVDADQKRIEQVLINLLSNSIKYAKRGGEITIQLQKNKLDKQLRVTVIDQGEGIAEEHLQRLFERFYRVDTSRSREEGGSGLGLSIVKHIVEAHKQKISVTSEQGKGTRFTFTLALVE